MKNFLVIGLGRFGFSLAVELCMKGNDVLALDLRDDRVQAASELVTHAVAGDARDPEVLRALGARNFDCAVVAASTDVGDSTLITLNLKELGVPHVVSKANSAVHRKVLEKIGADQVVFPEQEMALRLARSLSNVDILNFIELSKDYSVVERRCPSQWCGKTIKELDIRAKYRLNVVAIRDAEGTMLVSPGGEHVLREGDCLVVLGSNQDIERMEKL
ncbi:TrkA family potassium uptake protein [Flavonifractor sp. An100]|uniref:potassium channel family protein n=1 Tax=Flavonifractor sp. An100 TaxID=1965538 RepID=UPI000B38D3E8|nr:TrkA family potassium uptake protein [Flavonifractor sp. An100]OUQ81021.1 potassium transporter Trk [Flavonifractor sp. An100]